MVLLGKKILIFIIFFKTFFYLRIDINGLGTSAAIAAQIVTDISAQTNVTATLGFKDGLAVICTEASEAAAAVSGAKTKLAIDVESPGNLVPIMHAVFWNSRTGEFVVSSDP